MQSNSTDTLAPEVQTQEIFLVSDELCAVYQATTSSAHPTGAEILAAAGRPATAEQVVLQVLRTGGLESIRLDERAALAAGNSFVLATGDRTLRFTLDGKQFEWPHCRISGIMVRELAQVPAQHELQLICGSEATVVGPADLVDLSEAGVEQFITVARTHHNWKLKVQGVVLEYDLPEVKVADAMAQAGFDPQKAWHIYLLVKGEPKKEVSVDYIVDLRTPGIEKIRLMQRNVDNGDGQQPAPSRLFKVLAADREYLDGLGLRWETVLEGERRWLLMHDFPLPAGYTPERTMLALDIPKDYPASQVDMFYFAPFVSRSNGEAIPSTQVRATIGGVEYQGWSRHRNAASTWDAATDNVRTHLALVESCLVAELGE